MAMDLARQKHSLQRRLNNVAKIATFAGFLVVFIAFSLLSRHFLTVGNIINFLVQASVLSIIASGLTCCFAAGEIDISTGHVLSLAGVAAAAVLQRGHGDALAILLALTVGIVVGVLNGVLVGVFRLPSLISTMATGFLVYGVANIYTGAASIMLPSAIRDRARLFFTLGQGRILGFPVPVLIVVFIVITLHILLSFFRLGRHLYALGGNRELARGSGISFQRSVIAAFAICGLLSGLAGVITTSRLATGNPVVGDTYILPPIAAVYIGTTMFKEGEPHIIGSLVGALFMGVLSNGLTLVRVHFAVQYVVVGLVLIGAIAVRAGMRREAA